MREHFRRREPAQVIQAMMVKVFMARRLVSLQRDLAVEEDLDVVAQEDLEDPEQLARNILGEAEQEGILAAAQNEAAAVPRLQQFNPLSPWAQPTEQEAPLRGRERIRAPTVPEGMGMMTADYQPGVSFPAGVALWYPLLWYIKKLRWTSIPPQDDQCCFFQELAVDLELATGVRLLKPGQSRGTPLGRKAAIFADSNRALLRLCGGSKAVCGAGPVTALVTFGFPRSNGLKRRPFPFFPEEVGEVFAEAAQTKALRTTGNWG